MEAVQGEKRATLNIGIGWRGLNEDIERFKDNMEFTKLICNQEGIDPDDVYSQVPYEKGFQFLLRIERQVFEVVYLFLYVFKLTLYHIPDILLCFQEVPHFLKVVIVKLCICVSLLFLFWVEKHAYFVIWGVKLELYLLELGIFLLVIFLVECTGWETCI